MISTKKMEISEFLKIMNDNATEFPEFARLSQVERENMANLNILTGPAEAFYDNSQLVGVGGIRIHGVAESWLITPRDIRCNPDHAIRKQKYQEFLRITRETMKRMCDEYNLWRLFATGTLSTKFLEQLGFKKAEKNLVWTRTE